MNFDDSLAHKVVHQQTHKRSESAETLVSQSIRNIRHFIHAEGLQIGDPLPSEAQLGAMLKVSRTVIRETLCSMEALKLVNIGNGRRARVAGMDESVLALILSHSVQTNQITTQQILDVRRTIEMRTVGLAALRRTDREASQILAHVAAMRQNFDKTNDLMESDIAFHETIARASRNPMFALIVNSFSVITRQTWQTGWRARSTDEEHWRFIACHEEIAQAISKHERRVAEDLMAAHFDDTVKILLATGIN